MINYLHKHKFLAHLTAFTLMVLASVGMLFTISRGNSGIIWGLAALFAVGNVLAALTK